MSRHDHPMNLDALRYGLRPSRGASVRGSLYDLESVAGAQRYYDRAMRRRTAGARVRALLILEDAGYSVSGGVVWGADA